MLIKSVTFARPAASLAQLPEDGLPEAAIIGRSNVGKSSLLNALVGRKAIARISQTPGKTQALNYYRVEAGGEPKAPPERVFYLVDLPGYGYAKVSQSQRAAWQRFSTRYLTEREELAVVLQLIDSRHEPTALDLELLDMLRSGPVPFVLVLTKSDKLSKNQQQARAGTLRRQLAAVGSEPPIVLTSAEKKVGLDEVWGWVETFLPVPPAAAPPAAPSATGTAPV